MTHSPLVWIGLGGVSADDNEVARGWQNRLHWIMVAVALLSVPAYLLSTSELDPFWHELASILDFVILIAFVAEILWMMKVSSFPLRYLFENWLNVVIICGAAAAALGAATEWIAIVRAMRAAVAVLVLVRTAAEFRVLFTRKGAPMLVGIAVLTLLTLGALFYWLDPNIRTFTDGLWLAFITGSTVGYGDVVPTTPATRVLAVLTVLVGVAMMTLFTAHVVTFFVGGEDAKMRDTLQHEIRELRREIGELRKELNEMKDTR
jgi:voltage-gated potassium channel